MYIIYIYIIYTYIYIYVYIIYIYVYIYIYIIIINEDIKCYISLYTKTVLLISLGNTAALLHIVLI